MITKARLHPQNLVSCVPLAGLLFLRCRWVQLLCLQLVYQQIFLKTKPWFEGRAKRDWGWFDWDRVTEERLWSAFQMFRKGPLKWLSASKLGSGIWWVGRLSFLYFRMTPLIVTEAIFYLMHFMHYQYAFLNLWCRIVGQYTLPIRNYSSSSPSNT